MSDRTVHGTTQNGDEIVRYDRSGSWYIEFRSGARRRVGVKEAARKAAAGDPTLGLPGGRIFDAHVRPRVSR